MAAVRFVIQWLYRFLGIDNLRDIPMSLEAYKEKLRQFNSTDKYRSELSVLKTVLNLKGSEKAIDYGCGLGTAMKYLKDETGCDVYGFDITKELFDGDEFYFRTEIYFRVPAVYFLHSFAHIPNAEKILTRLKDYILSERGRIVIITPNKNWLDIQDKTNYKPDTTVVKHYNLDELKELLIVQGFHIHDAFEFGQRTNDQFERICISAHS